MSTLVSGIARQTVALVARASNVTPCFPVATGYGVKRCRTRSNLGSVNGSNHLAPRPRGGVRAYVTQAIQAQPTDTQTTYAASLLTYFNQRRHVDVTPILKGLRVEENSLLQLVEEIRSARRRGRSRSPALETLHEKILRILDSLNALEGPVRTLALRDPTKTSHGAGLQQIRSTVHRAALKAFVEHSQGLPFARQLLQRMWEDAREHACVGKPDSDVLGMMVKRFRYAEENSLPWKLEADTTHGAAFQTFLAGVLSQLKDLREDIFTLIMDIHVDSGMSVDSLKDLLTRCMRFSQSEWNGRWTPAAFHTLMQAYRRDGDVRGCIDTYREFRETMRAAEGDDAWNRRNFSTASWPCEAVLTACVEAREAGIRRNRYRPNKDMPEVIWRDIQQDGVVPPPRLLAYLIKLAVQGKDLKAAHRLWGIFFPIPANSEKGHRLIATPDMDCYAQYFKLVRQQPAAGGNVVPLRPLVRQLLESRVTAGQKLSSIRSLWTQVLETSLSAPYYDLPLALWILGRFNNDSHKNANAAKPDDEDTAGDAAGLTIDALVIDVAAERLINYWKAKPRGTAWTRHVFGVEGLALYLERQTGGAGAGAGKGRRRMPLGVRKRDGRARGATGDDWDMMGRRLEELATGAVRVKREDAERQEDTVFLPLAKPFARWDNPTLENSNKIYQTKIFNSKDGGKHQTVSSPQALVLRRFQRGLIKMLELCVAAKPAMGRNRWIEQAREVLESRGQRVEVKEHGEDGMLVVRVAMAGVRRDLFGS
ncbi:hypothetical protein QFC21_006090 [Naganishia friedmannii]|uniref:Uncharacterized protein n=1 Tax=Naganishia friedmannii TaxID=89922 RepID=A0ACC2V4Z9_9TREE|nr:hypothetical protein QFC21_006090 [Naganishia friedmannii]